jgi:hypothetical protein
VRGGEACFGELCAGLCACVLGEEGCLFFWGGRYLCTLGGNLAMEYSTLLRATAAAHTHTHTHTHTCSGACPSPTHSTTHTDELRACVRVPGPHNNAPHTLLAATPPCEGPWPPPLRPPHASCCPRRHAAAGGTPRGKSCTLGPATPKFWCGSPPRAGPARGVKEGLLVTRTPGATGEHEERFADRRGGRPAIFCQRVSKGGLVCDHDVDARCTCYCTNIFSRICFRKIRCESSCIEVHWNGSQGPPEGHVTQTDR